MIQLEVFHHSDTTAQLSKLDLDYSLEDCERRMIYFFIINAVGSYVDDVSGNTYALIHSNGQDFICCDSVDSVLGKIIGV